MVQLKDRNKQIPNGYRFTQAETNWDSTVALGRYPSLTRLRDALIQHRLGNPWLVKKHNWPTEPQMVEDEVAAYNAQICLKQGWNDYITSDTPIPKGPTRPGALTEAGVRFAGAVRNSGVGLAVFKDWLGENLRPVGRELGEQRAATCARCPLNQEGDFWQRIDAAVGRKVKAMIALKHDLDLKTTHDAVLKTCQACDCLNELKVWAPLDIVVKRMSDEQRAKLDKDCWILGEAKI